MSHLEAIIDKLVELEIMFPDYDYVESKYRTIHIENLEYKVTHHQTFKQACVFLINKHEKES